tara:strand:+ start:764 stop:961 length:198 start_codon:yes stop_codon:yes gene_type:complete
MGGIRNNTQGKLFTNEEEYIENMKKLYAEEDARADIAYAKKRGRPKKLKDKPIQKKYGEFILNFN